MDQQGQPHRANPRRSHALLLVRVLATAMLALGLLLPAVDHHLAERVPWHHHLIAGRIVWAGGAHHHAYEYAHQHGAAGVVFTAHRFDPALLPSAAVVAADGAHPALWLGRDLVLYRDGWAGHGHGDLPQSAAPPSFLTPPGHTDAPDPPPPILPS